MARLFENWNGISESDMWTAKLRPAALEGADAYRLSPGGTRGCQVERRAVYVIGHVPTKVPGMYRRPQDFPQM